MNLSGPQNFLGQQGKCTPVSPHPLFRFDSNLWHNGRMASIWKLPPREKIYEALSAIADDRVEMKEMSAVVTSSNSEKQYLIRWNEDFSAVISNDNASKFQGYLGYPILAVMMCRDLLPVDRSVLQPLAGIDWNALNKRHKRNYAAAVDEVLAAARDKDLPVDELEKSVAES